MANSVRFLWLGPALLLSLSAAGCNHQYQGPIRALPETSSWPCAYIWPGFAKEKTRVKLTKPVCREVAPRTVITRVLDSTVLVEVLRREKDKTMRTYVGTGSVIGSDGSVVTAHHVIADAVTVDVLFRHRSADGRSYYFSDSVPVSVIHDSLVFDAAVLQPFAPLDVHPPVLPVCRRDPVAGETMWHVGYRIAWSIGNVGQSPLIFTEQADVPFKVTAFSYVTLGYFGDSGGPIFDSTGHLLGLYVALNENQPSHGFGTSIHRAFTSWNYHAAVERCD